MTTREKSKKDRVFDYLYARLGQWVDGHGVLSSPEVGGGEGMKRLREARQELRDKGFRIEGPRRNPDPKKPHTPQYRLVRVEDVADRFSADVPSTSPAETEKKYLCPRPGCAHVLTDILNSEFDKNYGFGTCAIHNMQMVKL